MKKRKKITKEQALRLIEEKFGRETYVGPLCWVMPLLLMDDWDIYWSRINNREYHAMTSYFSHHETPEERFLLRMIVAYQFIEETYK